MKYNRFTDAKNAAKHYRDALGFNVIPLRAGSKVAALPKNHPYLYRRATEEELDNFDFKNIGIVTGRTSGVVVLDVDRGGSDTLEQNGWTIPPTLTAKTMNGRHYYFRYPSDAERVPTRIGFARSLDFKADGGYVVAPPSVVEKSGRDKKGIDYLESHHYEWVSRPEDLGIAECPEWLLKAVRERSGVSSVDLSGGKVLEGSRNDTIFTAAVMDLKNGIPFSIALLRALDTNRRYLNPPLSEDEVQRTVMSAYRYEAGDLLRREEANEVGVLLSDVEPESVEWLWEGRIPLGKITNLDGDPGKGKSVAMMDITARVTTGRPMPDGGGDHVGNLDHLDHLGDVGGVVILSAEDGLADTIRPRLDAAGADLSRVVALSTTTDDKGNERIVSIPEDISLIEHAIDRVDAKLVIIDPLMAFLSPKVDSHKDQGVRQALTPLKEMAERKGVAVLLIRHMSKQDTRNALYRGGGSIGIIGAARSGMVVEQHPDDEDLRVLAMLKSNLAEQAPSLTYTIVTAENGAAKVEWKGTTDHTADELLNGWDTTSKLEEARTWLREKLAEGPVLADKVEEDRKSAGISLKTLNRAKKGVAHSAKDGPEGQWRWHLKDGQHGQGGQEGQGGGQEGQGSQEVGDTESNCECGGRSCIHCLKQELSFQGA